MEGADDVSSKSAETKAIKNFNDCSGKRISFRSRGQ